jgi:hypothetical protein
MRTRPAARLRNNSAKLNNDRLAQLADVEMLETAILEASRRVEAAEREACEAYITSQRAEGWLLVPDRYDDGGFRRKC